jgi:hypothetical protein
VRCRMRLLHQTAEKHCLCKQALSPTYASSFVQDIKNVLITERPSLGQAALELRATHQLHFFKNWPQAYLKSPNHSVGPTATRDLRRPLKEEELTNIT